MTAISKGSRFDLIEFIFGAFAWVFASIWALAIITWFAVKVPAVIILIVNIGYLITAHNNGTMGHFDYFWLILSAIATILL